MHIHAHLLTKEERSMEGIIQKLGMNKYNLFPTKQTINKEQYLPKEIYSTLCINLYHKESKHV